MLSLIPETVTLRLHHYDGNDIADVISIKGEGPIDHDYKANVKKIAALSHSTTDVDDSINPLQMGNNFLFKVYSFIESRTMTKRSCQLLPTKEEKSLPKTTTQYIESLLFLTPTEKFITYPLSSDPENSKTTPLFSQKNKKTNHAFNKLLEKKKEQETTMNAKKETYDDPYPCSDNPRGIDVIGCKIM